MSNEIKIIIADDHPIVRRGLRQVIEGDAGLKVLAEADDGEQAVNLIQELKPQVAVLDVDSEQYDQFSDTDKYYLEQIVGYISFK